MGPKAACGIFMGIAKKAVRNWKIRDHRKHWELKQATTLMQGPSAN
jgi:hypothetical protein